MIILSIIWGCDGDYFLLCSDLYKMIITNVTFGVKTFWFEEKIVRICWIRNQGMQRKCKKTFIQNKSLGYLCLLSLHTDRIKKVFY